MSRWFRSSCGTARMAAAAREAISVRPSSSATTSDSVATKAPFRFNRLRFITSPAHARRPNRLNVPKNVQLVSSIRRTLMSGAIALEGLDLAALLCSRVCHDLISPVGAIANGLEVMEEGKDEETSKFAMDLIKKSARTASAKLQFCRIAFGAAGSAGAQIDTGDAEKVTRGLMEDEKTKIALESAARAAGQEPGQAPAQHDAARRPGDPARRPAHRRSGRRGRHRRLQGDLDRHQRQGAAVRSRRCWRAARPSIRSTPMRSSRSTRACSPRIAA